MTIKFESKDGMYLETEGVHFIHEAHKTFF